MDKRINDFMFWCNKVLPTAYDNSLSYYEVLCKTIEFLKYVLEKYNDLSGEIQDAVNEWITEHPEAVTTVEDGSLTTEKFVTYLQDKIDKFNSYPCVADMAADTELVEGAIVHTASYYRDANCGGAWYVIEASATANNIDVIATENGLFAVLIYNPGDIYLSQFGCHSSVTNNIDNINRAFACVESHGCVTDDCKDLSTAGIIEINTPFCTLKGCGNSYIYTDYGGIAVKCHAQGIIIDGIVFVNSRNSSHDTALDNTVCIEVVNTGEGNWYDIDFEIRHSVILFYSTGIVSYGKNLKVNSNVISNVAKGIINHVSYHDSNCPQHRGIIVQNNVFHGGNASLITNISDPASFPCFGLSIIGSNSATYGTREAVLRNNSFDSDFCGYMYKGNAEGLVIRDNNCEGYSAYCGIALFTGTQSPFTAFEVCNNRVSIYHRITNPQQYMPIMKPLYLLNAYNGTIDGNTLNYHCSFITLKGNCNPVIMRNNSGIIDYASGDGYVIGVDSGTTQDNTVRLCGNYWNAISDQPAQHIPLLLNSGSGTLSVGNSNHEDCNMYGGKVDLPA